MDALIIGLGLGSFVMFIVGQCLCFRLLNNDEIFKTIIHTALGAGGAGFCLSLWVCFTHRELWHGSSLILVVSLMLIEVIYGLLVFVYILCIFGPYETSIRMRLIRELDQAPQGLKVDELLVRYNAKKILEIRLKRLVNSQDVVLKDGKYFLMARQNVFFFIDVVAAWLKQLIQSPKRKA